MRKPLHWLAFTVAVLFAGTVGLVLLLSQAASLLTAKSSEIASHVAPSIVNLQAMRANVQKEHALADEWVLGLPREAAVRAERMDALQRNMALHRDAYLVLSPERGEAPIRAAVVRSLDDFESLVRRVRSQPPGAEGNPGVILHELNGAVGEVGGELARASDFDADLARAAAGEALGVTRTLLPWAVILGVVTAAAALGTIALTFRAVGRAERVEQASHRALERKAQELEAFTGRVAHDLLSPLMTVSLGLDVAQRALPREDSRAGAGVARAATTLHRVRGFVSDLLEFARAGATPPPGVHTPVGAVVHEVTAELEPTARDAGIELRAEPLPDRDVCCSTGVLTSMVLNLVQNAIKFMTEGEVRRVVVRALDLGREVRVEVEDTGPGVAAEEQERIFEPFARGRSATASGLGIGLATVRRLAEAHGGHTGLRSETGHGSVFWFSLPAAG